jgi:predicted MFS family arabinose efflux permease
MVPLALFSSANFVGLSLLTFLIYGALGGLLVVLPYVLIESAGFSATAAGAALLPFPIVMAIASPAMGAFAGRVGSKLLLVAGSLGVAAGLLLLLRFDQGVNYWRDIFPALLILALGMSGTAAPLTTAVLGSVDERHTGAASGLNSALARTGGLVVTALLGAVLSARGVGLIDAFHLAAIAGATMAAGAALCAAALIRSRPAP